LRFRREFSDPWYFDNYDDIRVGLDDWLLDYKHYRPHGTPGLMPPRSSSGSL
jgi:hypothetical protein